MFIAIYEFDVKDDKEDKFIEAWREVTEVIYKNYGSYGSRLQKDKSGKYVGYAQWPDQETWARDRSSDTALQRARDTMWSCLNSSKTVYAAEVISDYLQPEQYKHEPDRTMEEKP